MQGTKHNRRNLTQQKKENTKEEIGFMLDLKILWSNIFIIYPNNTRDIYLYI